MFGGGREGSRQKVVMKLRGSKGCHVVVSREEGHEGPNQGGGEGRRRNETGMPDRKAQPGDRHINNKPCLRRGEVVGHNAEHTPCLTEERRHTQQEPEGCLVWQVARTQEGERQVVWKVSKHFFHQNYGGEGGGGKGRRGGWGRREGRVQQKGC